MIKLERIEPGINMHWLRLPHIQIWFSYETPIAFMRAQEGSDGSYRGLQGFIGAEMVVRENDWGPTTGKHLNILDRGNKETRVPGKDFELMLDNALRRDDEKLRQEADRAFRVLKDPSEAAHRPDGEELGPM